MNSNRIGLLILGCVLASMACSLDSFAQEKKVGPDEKREIEFDVKIERSPEVEELFKIVGSKYAFGNMVKGAPFSATATTETVQTLIDGNQIINRNETTLYRDNEGRTRIEQTLGTIGRWTAGSEAKRLITINDPVAAVSYNLDPHDRTAYKGSGINLVGNVAVAVKGKETVIQVKRLDPGRYINESLGKQVVEGVEVELTRITSTIPAGEIGNTMPIEVVDETWYSPELQMVIMSKHRDPRSGETIYRLTNINRSEPDRSLFEVPADYKVKSDKLGPAVKNDIFIKEEHEQ
jgi:hypothetical protein